MKKVCIFTFYPGGGLGAMTKCFHSLFKSLGFEADIFYFDKVWNLIKGRKTVFDGLTYSKIPYIPVPMMGFANYVFPSFFLGGLLGRYDILFSVGGSMGTSLPFALARRPHFTKMATPYFDEQISKFDLKRFDPRYTLLALEIFLFPFLWKAIEGWLYRSRYNKTILMDSRYTKQQMELKYGPRGNVFVFPYCVDQEVFKPKDPDDRRLQDNARGRYIFACGRFADGRKNLPLLVSAFKFLKNEKKGFDDVKLLIAGFVPSPGDRFFAEMRTCGDICFLGRIDEGEKVKYYQNASLFVLPSRQEGLGIVILEAMACGTPVVSTRCGGPEEIIEDGYNGVFTGTDEKTMADDIARVLSDGALAGKLSENGLRTVREKFSEKAAMDVLKKAITCLEQPGVGGDTPA